MTNEEVLSFVVVTEDHWLWIGTVGNYGYGVCHWKAPGKTLTLTNAHRVVYQILVGPLSNKEILHHTKECGVKLCVRPGHTVPQLRSEHEDAAPMLRKNQTHCKYGHEFTEENTQHHTNSITKRKSRSCRKCRLLRPT